jgi:hypothetical protein
MNYEVAWNSLKELLEKREAYLREKIKTDKKKNEEITRGEIVGIAVVQQLMFDAEANAGLYTVKEEQNA